MMTHDDVSPICIVGHLTIDDIVLPNGKTSLGQIAGNALYAALGARIWWRRVAAAARIGPDFPSEPLARVRASHVELLLHEVRWPSIREWGLYESLETRQFVNRLTSGTHNQQSIRGNELADRVRAVAGCHVAPMPPRIQAGVVKRLRSLSVPLITLDPHVEYLRRNEAQVMAMLPLLAAFLPSRFEAAMLYGADDPEAAATALVNAGVPIVAIKLGGDGSIVATREDGRHHVPALAGTRVVDPTGAGDSYCGGFLAGLVASGDPVRAACQGTVSASFAVEGRGSPDLLLARPGDAEKRLRLVASTVRDGSAPSDCPTPYAPAMQGFERHSV